MSKKKIIAIVIIVIGVLIYPITLLIKKTKKSDSESTTSEKTISTTTQTVDPLASQFNSVMTTGLIENLGTFLFKHPALYFQSTQVSLWSHGVKNAISSGNQALIYDTAVEMAKHNLEIRQFITIWYLENFKTDMLNDLRISLTKENFNNIYKAFKWA